VTAGQKFARAGSFFLAAFALCLPFSIAAANVAWASSLILFLLSRAARKDFSGYRPTGLEWPWTLYFCFSVLSSVLSEDPGRSVAKLQSEGLILVAVLAAQAQSPESAGRNLRIFLGALGVAALWGCLQYALGINRISVSGEFVSPDWFRSLPDRLKKIFSLWNGRAVGFYNHPLTYAEVLLLGWPMGVAALLFASRRESRWGGLAAGAILAAVAFSGSRGVWLSLTAATLLWWAVRRDKRLAVLLVAVFIVWAGAVRSSPLLRERAAALSSVKRDSSNVVRLGLWDASMKMIRENPVWGVGIGNVRVKPDELRWGGSRPDMIWTEVHNIFFQMAVERGLLGLAAFLWFLARMGAVFWRVRDAAAPVLARGFFFGWVGLVAAGATESWTHDSEVMLALFFLLGTACALSRDEAADAD
jgi:O-antigen ligase